jgi:hypothetical protein
MTMQSFASQLAPLPWSIRGIPSMRPRPGSARLLATTPDPVDPTLRRFNPMVTLPLALAVSGVMWAGLFLAGRYLLQAI